MIKRNERKEETLLNLLFLHNAKVICISTIADETSKKANNAKITIRVDKCADR